MIVRWTRHARQRLKDIGSYIGRDSSHRADRFCNALIDATEQLSKHPYSGSILPEDGAYRQLVVDGFRIVYRVDAKAAYIMTIVAPGMLYDQSL